MPLMTGLDVPCLMTDTLDHMTLIYTPSLSVTYGADISAALY